MAGIFDSKKINKEKRGVRSYSELLNAYFCGCFEKNWAWVCREKHLSITEGKFTKEAFMKRINEYKKLFNVDQDTDLRQLKKTYRNLVKEWHTDKFPEGHEMFEEAELKSRQIIDAYHFLVSIAPETKAANLEEYEHTTTKIGIDDFKHKGLLLEITFLDGSAYEYFGVKRNVFEKLINTDKQMRFAKRSIFNSYLYRKSKKATVAEEVEVA